MAKPAQPNAVKTSPSSASRTSSRLAANLQRHARKCAICNHPRREEIDDDFLHWYSPAQIYSEYDLPGVSSLYRHAEATGLLARRRRNLRGVAERILESVDDAQVSGNAILRAMRIFAHVTEDGQWIEPPRVSIVEHRHSFANSPSPHALAVTKVEEIAPPAPPLSPAPVGELLVYPACPACPEQSRRERSRRNVGRAAPFEGSEPARRPPGTARNTALSPSPEEILIGNESVSRGEPND